MGLPPLEKQPTYCRMNFRLGTDTGNIAKHGKFSWKMTPKKLPNTWIYNTLRESLSA